MHIDIILLYVQQTFTYKGCDILWNIFQNTYDSVNSITVTVPRAHISISVALFSPRFSAVSTKIVYYTVISWE